MNKVILITGGAQRIGKEISKVFAADDWNVIIHYNSSEDAANELAKELNHKRDGSALVVQANLDLDNDVERLIKEAREAFGRIDAVINNASSFYATPLAEISNDNWDNLIGSNLKGPLFISRGLSDLLKESQGSIINITDINIDKGMPNFSIYSAAKGGLQAITKVLAKELAPRVKVNAVAPGAILEPPGKSWTEEELNNILSKIPLNRIGTEGDIANAVKFLVDSRYITGQTIKVDGGRSLA
tara:strand:+ start:2678 stop:3406 length:729 start_codon:yes stop_codon:yes gene_type:complete